MEFINSVCKFFARLSLGLFFIVAGSQMLFSWDIVLPAPKFFTADIPYPSIVVPFTIALSIAAAFALIVGLYTRFMASLLVIITILATLTMYPFWTTEDVVLRNQLGLEFLKNLAIFGGLFYIALTPLPEK